MSNSEPSASVLHGILCIGGLYISFDSNVICLDTYMLDRVYTESGICIRHHCGAEPPGDIEPSWLVTTVGGRHRASTSHVAAGRVKAPASATRGRFRRVHGR